MTSCTSCLLISSVWLVEMPGSPGSLSEWAPTSSTSPCALPRLGGIKDKPSREVWLAGSCESLATCPASNGVTQQTERLSWNWPRPRGLDSGTELPEGFVRVGRTLFVRHFSQDLQSDLFLTDHLPSRLVPCVSDILVRRFPALEREGG